MKLRTRLQAIPVQSVVILSGSFVIYYIEIRNNTAGVLSFAASDSATDLPIVPTQEIAPGALLTYKSKYGIPVGGVSWVASGEGLYGWAAYEKEHYP
jgi:hypothetical protein